MTKKKRINKYLNQLINKEEEGGVGGAVCLFIVENFYFWHVTQRQTEDKGTSCGRVERPALV